ncbi:DedA family protein [Candidatus Woesearchaeota archaeon]|nr:DedA family protein [Candidatus Woesearchaeota archaeon]
MVNLSKLVDLILHVDKYLGTIIAQYGILTYILLFLVIFAETGFVLTPFLPGDSLLFTIGAFSAQKYLNIFIIWLSLLFAAILGDSVNYWIGNKLGEKFFSGMKLFKPEYMEKTKEFYAKHGKKTIILARFVPIVRTFAPFVAGIGKMNYKEFLTFNIFGGFLWVSTFLWTGFFFGNLPIVKDNFSVFIIIIIIASFIPLIIELIKHKQEKKNNP